VRAERLRTGAKILPYPALERAAPIPRFLPDEPIRRRINRPPHHLRTEMIMTRRDLNTAFSLALSAAVLAISTLWLIGTPHQHVNTLAALPFAASALLMAGIAWKARPAPGSLAHYRRRHRPLAGPRPGAGLPE
jgi:hypothetical protein